MNDAWSVAARRSSSWAQAAIDTPSALGIDGGGDERRASGIIPDGGGALPDRGIGVADGGGIVCLRAVEGGARNGAADPPGA
jgi:hypothetical protein